jgi:hypothetical protein
MYKTHTFPHVIIGKEEKGGGRRKKKKGEERRKKGEGEGEGKGRRRRRVRRKREGEKVRRCLDRLLGVYVPLTPPPSSNRLQEKGTLTPSLLVGLRAVVMSAFVPLW